MVIKKGLLLTKSTSVLKGKRLKTLQGCPTNCCTRGQLVPVWYQTWYVLSITLVGSEAANKKRMANPQPLTNLWKYWSGNGGSWERTNYRETVYCDLLLKILHWAIALWFLLMMCLCACLGWSTRPLVLVKGKLGRNSRQEFVFPDFKPNCDCLITNLAKCAHFSLQIRMQEIACGHMWRCRDKRKNNCYRKNRKQSFFPPCW